MHKQSLPPLTLTGIAKYAGILSKDDIINVAITGNVPKGETTRNLTYSVVDKNARTILSQLVLPEASNQFGAVNVMLKVQRGSGVYEIGTFTAGGEFTPAGFYSVRVLAAALPTGSSGRAA